MITRLTHTILFESSWLELFLLTTVYFLFLYFVIGFVFAKTASFFVRKGWANRIVQKPLLKGQVWYEIRHSLSSVFVFGFSGFPIVFLVREGWLTLLPDTFWNVLFGVAGLNLWNELHFFLVHRLMHTSFFFRYVHKVHHHSVVPTVYSVYSFHWLEAFLLSTVPMTWLVFFPLSPLALFIYPLTSILLNFAGHSNARFGNGRGNPLQLFGTTHNDHHSKGRKNFGFATPCLDNLYYLLFKSHRSS